MKKHTSKPNIARRKSYNLDNSNEHKPFFDAHSGFFNAKVTQKKENSFFTPGNQTSHSTTAKPKLQPDKASKTISYKNKTGMPDNLKTGIENLSGYPMDDVKVHYNSNKPSQIQAHAYTRGTDIHLGSGQEKYLPHEAWHVVQQKQGRVKPTIQMKGDITINDDKGLEKEADIMGNKAMQTSFPRRHTQESAMPMKHANHTFVQKVPVIQRIDFDKPDWGKMKSTEVKGSNPGVIFVTFEDKDTLILKSESYNPGRESLASKLAQEAGLLSPDVRYIDIKEYTAILEHAPTKEHVKSHIIGMPLMLMKKLEGYDLSEIEKEKKEFTPKELGSLANQLGRWLAFNLFIGDGDLFQGIGTEKITLNKGNLILDEKGTLSGIDQAAAMLEARTLKKQDNIIFNQIQSSDKGLAMKLAKAILPVLEPKKGHDEKSELPFGLKVLAGAKEQFVKMKGINPEKIEKIAESVKPESQTEEKFDPAVEAILANVAFLNKKPE